MIAVILFVIIILAIIVFASIKSDTSQNNKRIPSSNAYPTSGDRSFDSNKNGRYSDSYLDIQKIEVENVVIPSENKQGKYIVLDIETTGLPQSKYNLIEETSKWPFILQLAWTIVDENYNIVKEQNYYLDYKGEIPSIASAINHIDKQLILEKGVDTVTVLKEFLSDALSVDYLVAHNIEFDLHIIRVELYRNKFGKPLESIETICTMKTSMFYVDAKKKDGSIKYPRLEELYQKCFKKDDSYRIVSGLHDAGIDVSITTKCFVQLIRDLVITPEGERINFDLELRRRVNPLRLNQPSELIMPLPHKRIIEKISEVTEIDGVKQTSVLSQTYFSPERKHAQLYCEEGSEWEKAKDLQQAITKYNLAIDTGDPTVFPYERLCIIYRKLKRYEDEINVINNCLDYFESIRKNDFSLDSIYGRLEKAISLNSKHSK